MYPVFIQGVSPPVFQPHVHGEGFALIPGVQHGTQRAGHSLYAFPTGPDLANPLHFYLFFFFFVFCPFRAAPMTSGGSRAGGRIGAVSGWSTPQLTAVPDP